MTCREFETLWSTRAPGDLPPAAERHASSCPACAAIARADTTTDAVLRRVGALQAIPDTDVARAAIRSALSERAAAGARWRFLQWALGRLTFQAGGARFPAGARPVAGRLFPNCHLPAFHPRTGMAPRRVWSAALALGLVTAAAISALHFRAATHPQRERAVIATGNADPGAEAATPASTGSTAAAPSTIPPRRGNETSSRPPKRQRPATASPSRTAVANPAIPPDRLHAGPSVPVGDLPYLNEPPGGFLRRWTQLPPDEIAELEKKLRNCPRGDDFVTVPFPRIAATGADIERVAAQAVADYRREAAIVDSRLFRKVTLAFKGTALSDLCARVQTDTGIRLEAGRSVADEKVTVFCKEMPLRDVMRQLSRPFGYTWLRSGAPSSSPNAGGGPPNPPMLGGEQVGYRYELVQDLRSQLVEEELRNRDRNAALLALEREIERYRPYMNLSPDEALARAKTAAPAEKKLLEWLAGTGWGPLQMYYRLSPQELAALRAGKTLTFSQEPKQDELPLPPDVARGVLERWRQERFLRRGEDYVRTEAADPNGLPLSAVPEARGMANLSLNHSELGRFILIGGSGFRMSGAKMRSMETRGPYAVGESPRVLQPNNRQANARLVQDPALRRHVTVRGQGSGVKGQGSRVEGQGSGGGATAGSRGPSTLDPRPSTLDAKMTTADVLEALHRASGLPIVADYYTRLYASRDVTVQDQPLFEALNRLADTMRMRWSKDGSWLVFRTTSYYDDRLKEVPNRLLARWAAVRKEHGVLRLEDLLEIVKLSDTQLQAGSMAEGARERFGLEEWDLARGPTQRPHLRYLESFTPAQRQAALSPAGLSFARMSLAQQQEYISLAFRYDMEPPNVVLEELASAVLRVEYAQPIGFEWRMLTRPGEEPTELFRLRGPTRDAALTAALQVDPQASPAQIAPAERALTFAYLRGRPETGLQAIVVRATDRGSAIWGPGSGG